MIKIERKKSKDKVILEFEYEKALKLAEDTKNCLGKRQENRGKTLEHYHHELKELRDILSDEIKEE